MINRFPNFHPSLANVLEVYSSV